MKALGENIEQLLENRVRKIFLTITQNSEATTEKIDKLA